MGLMFGFVKYWFCMKLMLYLSVISVLCLVVSLFISMSWLDLCSSDMSFGSMCLRCECLFVCVRMLWLSVMMFGCRCYM